MTRPSIFVANWKMYKTLDQTKAFFEELLPLLQIDDPSTKLLVAVPFTLLALAVELTQGSPILIGAQNMNDATEGAFTGEIAASMLQEVGCRFVLLGHSERRRLFGETDEFIRRKLLRAHASRLQPILCVGETLEERDGGQTEERLSTQINDCLEGVPKELFDSLSIAYEPIWAIGTGHCATPQIAQETHLFCRDYLRQHWGNQVADKVPLLYGGSVNPAIAPELMAQADIDGLLVGGASLKATSFAKIVNWRSAV